MGLGGFRDESRGEVELYPLEVELNPLVDTFGEPNPKLHSGDPIDCELKGEPIWEGGRGGGINAVGDR